MQSVRLGLCETRSYTLTDGSFSRICTELGFESVEIAAILACLKAIQGPLYYRES